jgi:hypothetical protein
VRLLWGKRRRAAICRFSSTCSTCQQQQWQEDRQQWQGLVPSTISGL